MCTGYLRESFRSLFTACPEERPAISTPHERARERVKGAPTDSPKALPPPAFRPRPRPFPPPLDNPGVQRGTVTHPSRQAETTLFCLAASFSRHNSEHGLVQIGSKPRDMLIGSCRKKEARGREHWFIRILPLASSGGGVQLHHMYICRFLHRRLPMLVCSRTFPRKAKPTMFGVLHALSAFRNGWAVNNGFHLRGSVRGTVGGTLAVFRQIPSCSSWLAAQASVMCGAFP